MGFYSKVLLLALASIQLGNTLKCYRCLDNPGGVCDAPEKDDNMIKECNATIGEVLCYFRNTTLLEGTGQIVRDCAQANECGTSRGADLNTTCTTCDTDLCNKNSGSNIIPSFLIISVLFTFLKNIVV